MSWLWVYAVLGDTEPEDEKRKETEITGCQTKDKHMHKHQSTWSRCMQQMVAPELAAYNKGVKPFSFGSSTFWSRITLVNRLHNSIGSTLKINS